MKLSVILCTHNPNILYLNRVLNALQKQTLSFNYWELIVIDNLSSTPINEIVQVNWHFQAKVIIETELGLTPARIRGIKEAKGNIIVFVDDDNLLDTHYLEEVDRIANDYPFIGSWGGQVIAEFETLPPQWTKPYLNLLAIKEFQQSIWSNLTTTHITLPCGAGLCVRKEVAQLYIQQIENDFLRKELDRKGESLSSCGDSDLALTACDYGLGAGLFKELKLIHIIPNKRLSIIYLSKLIQEMTYSNTLLNFSRGILPSNNSIKFKMTIFIRNLLSNRYSRIMNRAMNKGLQKAYNRINELTQN